MGCECPNGHGWQPQVHIITKDGLGARKATDALAKRLGCGCVVGGEDYKKFVDQCNALDAAAFAKIQAAQTEAQQQKAALWQAIKNPTGSV